MAFDLKGFIFSLVKPAAPAGSVNLPVQVDVNGPNACVSISAPLTTSSVPGLAQVDGTTITASGGVISAAIGGVSAKTASYTAVAGDNGKLLSFNSGSAVTLTLPASPPSALWRIAVQNIGAGVLTVDRNGKTIDGAAANLTLSQNSGVLLYTDGTNYFTERGVPGITALTGDVTASGSGSVVATLANSGVSAGTYPKVTVDAKGRVTAGSSLTATDLPANTVLSVIGLVIDGAGSVPTTGSKGFVQVPFAGTITGWTLLGDVSGSAQITVSKGTYAAYPTVSSIVASAPPVISSAQKATSTTLTGWTTAVAAGDILSFNLDSVSTCTRLLLELQITRS